MPEWPDLHVLRDRLERALAGRRIERVRVGDPTVLRATRPAEEILAGRRFERVRHRGHHLLFDLDAGVRVAVNPMLAGLFELRPASARAPVRIPLSLTLEGGTELRYRDEKRMGKVHLLEGVEPEAAIRELAEAGAEAGDLRWSEDEFERRARERRSEVRNLLMDHRFIAGIGNAYADEILWEAMLHPKRPVRSLSDEELRRLHRAIRGVMRLAVDAVEAGLPPRLGEKVRSHLRVRGRAGQPCRRCGARIVETRHGEGETDLCVVCQPPPEGRLR